MTKECKAALKVLRAGIQSKFDRELAAIDELLDEPVKNREAVTLGRLGGLKGGPARAEKLSAERRREIAHKAAIARWHK